MDASVLGTLRADLDAVTADSDSRDEACRKLLGWASQRFRGRIVIAASFGAEDVVLLDLLVRSGAAIEVLTLDTGRLPEETHEVIEAFRRRGLSIEVHVPEATALATLLAEAGPFSFRTSLEARQRCCRVRKVEPLRAALRTRDAWITGIRREQAPTRREMQVLEWDEAFGLVKLNPLLEWSEAEVWEYIGVHRVPYNRLHDRGYPSIGCAPCTRAVAPGEDPRAGRWWWERPEQKECGLHLTPSPPRSAAPGFSDATAQPGVAHATPAPGGRHGA